MVVGPIGSRRLTSGEAGGEPSVDDKPPTTEGEKWTFFVESEIVDTGP